MERAKQRKREREKIKRELKISDNLLQLELKYYKDSS